MTIEPGMKVGIVGRFVSIISFRNLSSADSPGWENEKAFYFHKIKVFNCAGGVGMLHHNYFENSSRGASKKRLENFPSSVYHLLFDVSTVRTVFADTPRGLE